VEASSDALASVAERLTARYGDLLPAETIHRALHEAYDALQARSAVTVYLPVLAERSASARLASLAAETA